MFKGYVAFERRRTQQRSFKNKEYSLSNSKLLFGKYGVKLLKKGFLVVRELIPLKHLLQKTFKGIAKVWTRFLPQKVITKKPEEVRMGKGKGKFFSWIAPVKAGMIIFEFSDCIITKEIQAKLNVVMRKLSIKCKLVKASN